MTSARHGLDRSELATTALAVLLSSTFYVAYGHPYLARGVLGDLVGLAALTAVLIIRRRRGRHEALACLGVIAGVSTLSPEWPLVVRGEVWWGLVVAAVAGYVVVRQGVLSAACRG